MQNDMNYVPCARGGREVLGVRGQAICLPLQLLREKEPLLGGESCSFSWAASWGRAEIKAPWGQVAMSLPLALGTLPLPGHRAQG